MKPTKNVKTNETSNRNQFQPQSAAQRMSELNFFLYFLISGASSSIKIELLPPDEIRAEEAEPVEFEGANVTLTLSDVE